MIEWTADQVKEHFESILSERDQARADRERAAAALREDQIRAQSKFEVAVDSRFTQVNDFRGSLNDLSKQMATRREMETAIANVSDQVEKARNERQHQIDDLRTALDVLRSRLDVGAPQIPELQAYVANQSGRSAGVQFSTGLFFAGLAALGTIIGILVVLSNLLTGHGQ